MRLFGTRLVCGLATLLLVPTLALAQTGSISGTITATDTEGPLPGASVQVLESGVGTAADVDGNYEISGVQAGEKTLRVTFVGYKAIERTVDVQADETTTADFTLEPTTSALEEVVVTGVSSETPRAKLSFKVDQVSSEDLNRTTSTNPVDALRGKISGASITSASGEPGTGSSVRLRATTSLTGDSQPLFIVDGVILGADQVDLSSTDIKNMEVVKGAAASSLYGSRAQNGVINITTMGGQENELGETRVTARTEFGVQGLEENLETAQAHGFLTNEDNQLVGGNGEGVNYASDQCCVLDETGPNGTRFIDNPYSDLKRADGSSYQLFDPFDQFFDPGNTTTSYLAISQNSERTNFRISFEDKREQGIVSGPVSRDGYDRQNFSLKLDHRPSETVTVSATGRYGKSNSDRLGAADINPFFGLMFTNPLSDLTKRDENGELVIEADPRAVEENPLYHVENAEISNKRSRFLGNLRTEYEPFEWLTLQGNLSYDRLDRRQTEFYDKGYKTLDPSDRNTGETSEFTVTDEALNADVTASFQKDFGIVTTRSQLKYQIERQDYRDSFVQGNELSAVGIGNFENISDPSTKFTSSTTESIRSEAFYATSQFDLKDRYIVDVMVRRDGSSLFGPEERWQTYFRAAGAWRLSEEEFWPAPETINEFKLRYSYGTAGGRPDFSAQYETYELDQGNFTKNTLGNDKLKPELQTEQEYGLEIGVLDRVFLDLTYADTEVKDQLLQVPLSAPLGFRNQWQNAGTLESTTIEASLDATILRTSEMQWNIGTTFDRTRQQITQFDVPPFRVGPEDIFYYRQDEDIGAMYGNKWVTSESQLETMGLDPSKFEKNDDGYMVPVGDASTSDGFNGDACSGGGCWGTSVSTAQGALSWGIPFKFTNEEGDDFLQIGDSVPNFNVNFNTTFQYGGFDLYLLVSHQNGGDVYNFTKQWAYRDNRHRDQDQSDVAESKKKPEAYYQTLYDATNKNSHFVEDATFTKLREVSLGYTFDEAQLNSLLGDSNVLRQLSIDLTGRNLLTFTDYSGFDPEVGDTGGDNEPNDSSLFRVDNFSYPTFRTITGRIEVQF